MLERYQRILKNAKKTEQIREKLHWFLMTEIRMKLNLLELEEK